MAKAGIIIDSWKLAIFSRNLSEANYTWQELQDIIHGTHTLIVHTEDLNKLADIVQAAHSECKRSKMQ